MQYWRVIATHTYTYRSVANTRASVARVKSVGKTGRKGPLAPLENPASATYGRGQCAADKRGDMMKFISVARRVTAGASDTEKQSPTLDKYSD